MRRILPFVIGVAAVALIPLPAATAAPLTVSAPVDISIPTPFAAGLRRCYRGQLRGRQLQLPGQ